MSGWFWGGLKNSSGCLFQKLLLNVLRFSPPVLYLKVGQWDFLLKQSQSHALHLLQVGLLLGWPVLQWKGLWKRLALNISVRENNYCESGFAQCSATGSFVGVTGTKKCCQACIQAVLQLERKEASKKLLISAKSTWLLVIYKVVIFIYKINEFMVSYWCSWTCLQRGKVSHWKAFYIRKCAF